MIITANCYQQNRHIGKKNVTFSIYK